MNFHFMPATTLFMLFVFPVGPVLDPKKAMDHPHTQQEPPRAPRTESTTVVVTLTGTKANLLNTDRPSVENPLLFPSVMGSLGI